MQIPSDLTNEGLANSLTIYSDGTNYVLLRTRTSYFETYFSGSGHDVNKHVTFIVGYIPMSDIKIKVDNQRTKRDVQLYNQNGKLTDNFALSKMINSYSKEISSDTITKYYTTIFPFFQVFSKKLKNRATEAALFLIENYL